MRTPTPLEPLTDYVPGLYAKIEYLHPSGSMKHRSIPVFLEQLIKTEELRRGRQIAIRSAGSAAVTTAWAGARIGCPVIAVLPASASQTTVKLLKWLGATCHIVSPQDATRLMAEFESRDDVYVLAQASEPRLVDHYRTVGAEILSELKDVAAITVGIGTGLSVTGIGREIAESRSRCRVYGVEPAEAAIASGRPWAPHHIPGLAPPIPQPLLDRSLLGDILLVRSEEAWQRAQEVVRRCGLPLGPSAGATVAAAIQLRERGITGAVVAVCACSISEYLDDTPA
jgi:cysteine synthase